MRPPDRRSIPAPRVQRAPSTHTPPQPTRRRSCRRRPRSPSPHKSLPLPRHSTSVPQMAAAAAAHVASSEAVRSQPSPGGGILARVDRLDIMLGYLEKLRGSHSSTTSSTSTAAGGAATSEVSNSSVNSSPRSTDRRRRRPIEAAVVETQVKGNLMDRVEYLEKRLLKLEEEKKKTSSEIEEMQWRNVEKKMERKRGKGLKRLVASCVKGNLETQ